MPTPKQRRFLKAIAINPDRTAAARAAKIDRGSHYEWLKADPAYPALFAAAWEQGNDAREDEATNRAMIGVFEPTTFKGRFCYPQEEYEFELAPAIPARPAVFGVEAIEEIAAVTETRTRDVPGAPPIGVWKKSDQLIIAGLRATRAEYRATAVEITGKDGGPVQVSLAEVLRERKAKREEQPKP